MVCANDRRHTQFAADDGGMARTSASIGDNRGGFLHDWLPVGVGLVCYKHLALLKLADKLRALDDAYPPRGNLFADAAPAGQHRAAVAQFIGLQHIRILPGLHGFGTGLHDKQVARVSVLRPFEVHWSRLSASGGIMIFNNAAPPRELQHFVVGQR